MCVGRASLVSRRLPSEYGGATSGARVPDRRPDDGIHFRGAIFGWSSASTIDFYIMPGTLIPATCRGRLGSTVVPSTQGRRPACDFNHEPFRNEIVQHLHDVPPESSARDVRERVGEYAEYLRGVRRCGQQLPQSSDRRVHAIQRAPFGVRQEEGLSHPTSRCRRRAPISNDHRRPRRAVGRAGPNVAQSSAAASSVFVYRKR